MFFAGMRRGLLNDDARWRRWYRRLPVAIVCIETQWRCFTASAAHNTLETHASRDSNHLVSWTRITIDVRSDGRPCNATVPSRFRRQVERRREVLSRRHGVRVFGKAAWNFTGNESGRVRHGVIISPAHHCITHVDIIPNPRRVHQFLVTREPKHVDALLPIGRHAWSRGGSHIVLVGIVRASVVAQHVSDNVEITIVGVYVDGDRLLHLPSCRASLRVIPLPSVAECRHEV